MRRPIPAPLIAVIADYVAGAETHDTLNSLLLYAGCSGDPPPGSKQAKALAWLRETNKDQSVDPLEVAGRLLEGYMDKESARSDWDHEGLMAFREKVASTLSRTSLRYMRGGKIVGSLGGPTKSLETFIRDRDLRSISEEFERAAAKAESEPREAVSAAANILESICKYYIADRGLQLPAKQTLGELWEPVRKDLGFDPSKVADEDLRGVVAGLVQVVKGLGAFRTHASSAHGQGPKSYRLEPRHSRLAVHAAHTAALFILESWERKTGARA